MGIKGSRENGIRIQAWSIDLFMRPPKIALPYRVSNQSFIAQDREIAKVPTSLENTDTALHKTTTISFPPISLAEIFEDIRKKAQGHSQKQIKQRMKEKKHLIRRTVFS